MNNLFQLFYTNDAGHFNAPDGLTAIPGWADRAVVQIEFCRTETNSNGERFALVGSPGEWLSSKGVEVWYYVDPVAPVLLGYQSQQVNVGEYVSDPFWFRKRQANAILGNGWLLMDAAGNPVIGGGRRRAVPDIGNFAYIEWLAAEVIKAGVKKVFLDNYNPHQHAFHRPQRAAGQDGNDTRYIAGMMLLCQRLRAAGIVIMANGAWEMSDPDEPGLWHYPLMPYVDAVCIELEHKPSEGRTNTGFARWSDGKFWTPDMAQMAQMFEHWQDADCDVLLAVTWRGGPVDYETFANAWHEGATMGNYWLFTGIEPGATHRVDRYMLPTTPEPEPTPDIGAELQHIRLDIAAATALLGKAAERLQALEASA